MKVSGQIQSSSILSPRRKSHRYPSDRSLSGPQSRCGRCEEEKYILFVQDTEPQFIGRSAHSPSLCRLGFFISDRINKIGPPSFAYKFRVFIILL
jgi:hypothetical protein